MILSLNEDTLTPDVNESTMINICSKCCNTKDFDINVDGILSIFPFITLKFAHIRYQLTTQIYSFLAVS